MVASSPAPQAPAFYVCHADHNHDEVFRDNIIEYMTDAGIPCRAIRLSAKGPHVKLEECLEEGAVGIIGFNAQLDRTYLGSTTVVDAAEQRGIPVIQWILDHPTSRLNEFYASTADNSRFVFSSANAERYFKTYGIPGALTATVACVGPSRHSRAEDLSRQSFAERPILAMIAINLRRLGGTLEDALARAKNLGPPLSDAVVEAARAAFFDIVKPLEVHFDRALDATGRAIPNVTRHACMQMVEEIVQIRRRKQIFEVAREFPILIQSDEASRPYQAGAKATFVENVDMASSWARLKSARAQIGVSNMHDMVHDRTLNGLNAGCLNVVEDSEGNRRAFADGRDALFFRYDNDSLRTCLDLVCTDVNRAYEIAAAGFARRDEETFRFGDFHKIVDLARLPLPSVAAPV